MEEIKLNSSELCIENAKLQRELELHKKALKLACSERKYKTICSEQEYIACHKEFGTCDECWAKDYLQKARDEE